LRGKGDCTIAVPFAKQPSAVQLQEKKKRKTKKKKEEKRSLLVKVVPRGIAITRNRGRVVRKMCKEGVYF
jgi:hypothetical protein